MQTLFGFDLSTGQKWIIAFAVILALLALLGLFARQIKGGGLRLKGQGGGRARLPRLGVVDTFDLDRQRQLVLIRRDNVEHLIMIGGAGDVVVETNIVRGGSRAAQAPLDLAMGERPQALEALVQPELARSESEPRRIAPQPTMPEPIPQSRQPVPPSQSEPMPERSASAPTAGDIGGAVAAAAGAGVLAGVTRAASPLPGPTFARDFSPAPAVSASELDDMARQLEEALQRPHSTVRGPQTQSSAGSPAPAPRQDAAPKPAASVADPVQPPLPAPSEPLVPIDLPAWTFAPAPAAAPAPAPAAAPAQPMPSPPAPPVMVGQPTSPPMDVEAELALALGIKPERLSAKPIPVTPMPVAPPAPLQAPRLQPEPASIVAPAPAQSGPVPDDADQAEEDTGLFDAAAPAIAEAEPADERPAKAEPSFAPEPMFEPGPAPEPEADPEDPPPPPEPKPAAIDPFSVDAIEAEFARLLGRDPKAKT